jgi:hypothetical protein
VYDVMREFNAMGGTTASVDTSGINNNVEPYEANTPFNDTSPTIHIGFTDDPNEVDTSGVARASAKYLPDASCEYNEVRITFEDKSLLDWNFGTPSNYYTATDTDSSGAFWFRPVMMHELLHAFGLDHSADSYSFMNGGWYPWAGGGGDMADAIKPLPDDVRALRDLYPASGDRSEIALLTTWYDRNRITSGAADQVWVCSPSRGSAISTGALATAYCGVGGPNAGSTTVCAGDNVYAWYVMANYSTDTADDISVRMYLSTDDVYSSNDLLSPSTPSPTVEAARSKVIGNRLEVPSGLTSGTKYYVILHALGTTSSGDWVEDWTPLPGRLTAC